MTDTLRSICEQCPNLSNPRLDFIPVAFARNRDIILRDLQELVSAATAERDRTVTLLSGTILEAILFTLIQSQESYISERRGAPFSINPQHSLKNFVEIFNRYFRDLMPSGALPEFVVGYRDLVHINNELNAS